MSWWSDQTEGTQGGLLGALGGFASGLFGYKGTKDQNIASAAQAQQQMAFQERMSNTAHQRQMADMRKAGLNPILSAKYGGASSPAGQQAPMHNKAAVALQNATTAANIANIASQTNINKWKGITAQGQSIPWQVAIELMSKDKKLWDKIPDFPEMPEITNPFSNAKEAYIANKKRAKQNIAQGGSRGKTHLRKAIPQIKERNYKLTKRTPFREFDIPKSYQTKIRQKRRNR